MASAIVMVVSSPTKSKTAVAPEAVGELADAQCGVVVRRQAVVRTELACEVEALLHDVDGDHLRAGEATEKLHRVRAQPTGADDDRGRAREPASAARASPRGTRSRRRR